jgi:signal transduction histidine kinase
LRTYDSRWGASSNFSTASKKSGGSCPGNRKPVAAQNLTPKLPRIVGDSLLLQQTVLNIVLNAEQALANVPGKRRIEVSTARRDNSVELRIADTGPGIPKEVLPRLFEPFFTTKEVGKGTGLGLAIAYGIVQKHGGQLHAANRREGGAVFTVESDGVE